MTAEQIIQKSEELRAATEFTLIGSGSSSFGKFLLILAFVIAFAGLIFLIETDNMFTLFGCMFLALCLLLGAVEANKDNNIPAKEKYEKWINTEVKTFVSEIDKKRAPLFSLVIDSSVKRGVNHWYEASNTFVLEEKELTPSTVVFKGSDNDLITIKGWYKIKLDLKEKEEPYVEYQYLDTDLDELVKSDYYNVEVHLPVNYKY